MNVLERMKEATDRGGRCTSCGTTAVDCQIVFLEHNRDEWCCASCRQSGPTALHTDMTYRHYMHVHIGSIPHRKGKVTV